jgi:chromate transporter
MRSLTDIPTVIIAIASALILWRLKWIKEPYLIIAAALTGLFLKMVV